ncbi:MAG TPA: DUF4931 domain-containing protein [Lacipirellulaceae bacterium]|nr:DUF4931 domain-containing protein [Lacipirellulaceae bacterium]
MRSDSLTGRSVLIAENRASRPNEFAGAPAFSVGVVASNLGAACPFCAGSETRTPAPTYEKLDEQGRWQVRVVPNVYPALTPAELVDTPSLATTAGDHGDTGMQVTPAVGVHEVIIECPNHRDRLSALSVQELRMVVEAYVERLLHWRQSGTYQYGLVFKNQGAAAGASISHLHSQLIVVPRIPPIVAAESARAREEYARTQQCPYCRLVKTELAKGERIVVCREGFVAFCPFASWQPFEIWLMPANHDPSIELATPSKLDQLTYVLHALISRLEAIVPGAAYNLLMRTAPWSDGCDEWSHWRIELLPRMNALAGIEVATGIHINSMAPERAALKLRTGHGR